MGDDVDALAYAVMSMSQLAAVEDGCLNKQHILCVKHGLCIKSCTSECRADAQDPIDVNVKEPDPPGSKVAGRPRRKILRRLAKV